MRSIITRAASCSKMLYTADGYPLHIGALCDIKNVPSLLASFDSLRGQVFGRYTDPYAIDYRLRQYIIGENCPSCVVALAASIGIPGVTENCGGVVGSPFLASQSASGALCKIAENYYGVAFPGAYGAAFYFEGDAALLKKLERTRESNDFLGILNKLTQTFIVALDGSGQGKTPRVISSLKS